jgi:hypothetical protein
MVARTVNAAIGAYMACMQIAAARSESQMIQALGEVAGELQTCSVYFLIGSSCIKDQRPDIAKTYRELSDKVADLAIKSSRSVGLSDAAYAAQASLDAEAMMKAMQGKCMNISVLLRAYMNFCQRLSRDADPRLGEWITCIRERRPTCGSPRLP